MISSSPCSFSLDVQVVQGSVILPPPPPPLREDAVYEDGIAEPHFETNKPLQDDQGSRMGIGVWRWQVCFFGPPPKKRPHKTPNLTEQPQGLIVFQIIDKIPD